MKVWAPGEAIPATETPGYLPVGAESLYLVRHSAAAPRRGAVVMAGPMSLERSHGFLTWVRWARNLAANGFEAWRFDYRGVGESSGDFREQSFDTWYADLEAVLAHARANSTGPVFVLGLRMGALFAQKAHGQGLTAGCVAWEPPAGGKPMLMDMLRRKLAADYMEASGSAKKLTREDYVRSLEGGQVVEVEGYPWSPGLWKSAEPYGFSAPPQGSPRSYTVYLDGRTPDRLPAQSDAYAAFKIPKPPFWLQSFHLVSDLAEPFARTVETLSRWAEATPAASNGEAPTALATAAPQTARSARRRLDVADLPAGRCVGTVHVPDGPAARIGLLWVNFGYVPRDGHGGLATFVSDALALKERVPCFRYDLPGLGDAPGTLPDHTHKFFPVVTSGSFTEVTSQLVEHVCEREKLDGVVLGGLCGGAVNAIFTAHAQKRVKGLLLLEPEMYVTEPKRDEDEKSDAPAKPLGRRARLIARAEQLTGKKLPLQNIRAKVFSYWGWMRLLTMESKVGHWIPFPRKAVLDFFLSRSALPSVTNVPLASAWQQWVAEHHPALIITADSKLREVFFDRINSSVLAGIQKRRYEHVRLKHTNHIFTTGGAIETVTGHVERSWSLFG